MNNRKNPDFAKSEPEITFKAVLILIVGVFALCSVESIADMIFGAF